MARALTIEVPEEVYDPLARTAARQGRRPEEVACDWLKRSAELECDDPLLQLLGSLESDVSDLGQRHDDYLGQALMNETGRGTG